MVKAVEMLSLHLEQLPQDHPDRSGIEAMIALGKNRTKPEQLIRLGSFNDNQKGALEEDKAVVLSLTGETIRAQRAAKRLFWYVVDTTRVLDLSSILGEVAIYPDPKRFFVPGSNNKDLLAQDDLVKEDGALLEQRLGIKGVGQIIPDEAATLTEVSFRYFDQTNRKVRLFGSKYGYNYGRTKNPTNESGSLVADVGYWRERGGLSVADWYADKGFVNVWAVRLVVPVETK